MKYEVVVTARAAADLRAVFEYMAYELLAGENAVKQLDRLEKAILSLDEMPERFRLYDKEPWNKRNLRIMPVDNYLVFYIPLWAGPFRGPACSGIFLFSFLLRICCICSYSLFPVFYCIY